MSLSCQKFYHLLYNWYEINHRILPWRETSDPYCIWLSEIILQQTRVVQGLEYYHRFVTTYPTVESLATADEDEVLRLWQGLGYYSRARNLHKAAKLIVNQPSLANPHKSQITNHKSQIIFPATFDELRALPGVGDYTAGAIASFAYDLPYPALDGNVYRVLARLYDCDEAFDTSAGKKYFHKLAEELLDREHPRLFNSAIMEFGALHCLPQSPDCTNCPLQQFCKGYAAGTAELLPVRKPRPTLRDRWFSYTIYIYNSQKSEVRDQKSEISNQQSAISNQQSVYTLIHQRKQKDIWQHLYEFPLVEHTTEAEWQEYKPSAVSNQQSAISNQQSAVRVLPPITHILSHQRLHARFFVVPVDELPVIADTLTVTWQALDDYALSRLTLKALESVFR